MLSPELEQDFLEMSKAMGGITAILMFGILMGEDEVVEKGIKSLTRMYNDVDELNGKIPELETIVDESKSLIQKAKDAKESGMSPEDAIITMLKEGGIAEKAFKHYNALRQSIDGNLDDKNLPN